MVQDLLDLYSDYLLCTFGQATATGLEQVVHGSVSHDQITRGRSGKQRTGAELWRIAKPLVRKIQSPDGVLIVDAALRISEKPYSDENDIVCWHYDPQSRSGKVLKGINLMTALYHVPSRELSLPVEFRARTLACPYGYHADQSHLRQFVCVYQARDAQAKVQIGCGLIGDTRHAIS